ncbi:hypothetical protein [Candidatus Villigracilis proximus]|uniref:hypothetical protein n=1 Tax=Candidatus Villigracilis proximus TaxID=3140683 RepID=UPI0031E8685D
MHEAEVMHHLNSGGGGQCVLPLCASGCSGKQNHQRADSFSGGFFAGAFTCPAHVIGEHLVKGQGALCIEAPHLALQFLLDLGQHDFNVLF